MPTRRPALRAALGAAALTVAIACAARTPVPASRPAAGPHASPAPSATVDEILRRAEAIRDPDLPRAAELEIESVLPDARAPARHASYSVAASGAADLLALRQSDDDMRGATMLVSADRMWVLRPGLGTRQPYELVGAQSRLGDWVVLRAASLDLLSGWQASLAGEERYGDEPCYKLELTLASTHSPWTRILYWVGKSDFRPKRIEGYATGGSLVSMIRYEGFAEGPMGTFARRIIVEGATPQDEIHTATLSEVRPLPAGPASFTVEGMLALKDAARERGVMTRNATRVRIEDLLSPR